MAAAFSESLKGLAAELDKVFACVRGHDTHRGLLHCSTFFSFALWSPKGGWKTAQNLILPLFLPAPSLI